MLYHSYNPNRLKVDHLFFYLRKRSFCEKIDTYIQCNYQIIWKIDYIYIQISIITLCCFSAFFFNFFSNKITIKFIHHEINTICETNEIIERGTPNNHF